MLFYFIFWMKKQLGTWFSGFKIWYLNFLINKDIFLVTKKDGR